MSGSEAPARWLVLRVPPPGHPEVATLVVEEMLALGARGVEEQEDGLVAYLAPPDDEDPHELVLRLVRRIQSLTGKHLGVEHAWQDHEEWAETWREGLRPRRVSRRLVVSPSWFDPRLEPGDILLTIDPGMAFGTAEHATTRTSLHLLDELVAAGERVLDVGAGSGILSIAAARLGADSVLALEVDRWSCETARQNAAMNGVADRIRVKESAVTPGFAPEGAPFDGIVANIESAVLVPLLADFLRLLVPQGWLVLSGILASEAAEVRPEAEGAGFSHRREVIEDEWWTAAFVARTPDAGRAAPGSPGARA